MRLPPLIAGAIFYLLLRAHGANAQGLTDTAVRTLYQLSEPCVAQLSVTGVFNSAPVPSRNGNGVVLKTDSGTRVLTAKHVVRTDGEFDPVPEGRIPNRDIIVTMKGQNGAQRIGTLHTALASGDYDVAQVFLDGTYRDCLRLSNHRPDIGDSLLVVSWAAQQPRAQPTAVRVLAGGAVDGPLVRVDHQFFEGESGAPVLDGDGNIAGILVWRDQPQQAASFSYFLPAAEFLRFVPEAMVAPPMTREANWIQDPPIRALPEPPLACGCMDMEIKNWGPWQPVQVLSGIAPNGSQLRATNHCASKEQLLVVKDTLPLPQAPYPPGGYGAAPPGFAAAPAGFVPVSPISRVPGRLFALDTFAYHQSVVYNTQGATGLGFFAVSCAAQ